MRISDWSSDVCSSDLDKSGNDKALIDYIDARGQFPSRSSRFCTSDWKRGPIRRTINAYRRQINHQSPYVLHCMGMRSQESVERSKLDVLEFVNDASCTSKPWPDVLDAENHPNRHGYFDWHTVLH